MASSSAHVKLFSRVARERLDDASFLLTDEPPRTTAAVYLCGYVVECVLKALILSAVPRAKEASVLASFRGVSAHDYDILLKRYREEGGAAVPRAIVDRLEDVGGWTVNLRYSPRRVERQEAADFLEAAREILEWAEARF